MENKVEDKLISEIHGITIDYTRDSLLDDAGKIRLRESYMKDDETSPQERFAFVSKTFSSTKDICLSIQLSLSDCTLNSGRLY